MDIFKGTESIITRSAPDKTNRQTILSRDARELQVRPSGGLPEWLLRIR